MLFTSAAYTQIQFRLEFIMEANTTDPNQIDPLYAMYLNGVMAFRWRDDDGPILNAGLVACDFSGHLDQFCYETLYF